MTAGKRQMLEQVAQLGPRPGRVRELRREEPADIGVEQRETEVHEDQRQQEAGHGQADEADEGEDIVADGVLANAE